MPRGFGFLSGIVDGFEAADKSAAAAQQAEANKLSIERSRAELDDANRARTATREVEASVAASQRPGLSQENFVGPLDDNAPTTASGVNAEIAALPKETKAPPIHEAFEKVSRDRFAKGDYVNGQKFLEASAAQRTLYQTTEFNRLFAGGDAQGIAALLTKQYPDGINYSTTTDPQTGAITATATKQDGSLVGPPAVFKDFNEFGAFVQKRMNPGDIYATNLAAAKAAQDAAESAAKVKNLGATTANTEAQTVGKTQDNKLDGEFGPKERAAKIKQAEASAAASYASANSSNASAAVAGQTPEIRNFGYAAKLSPDQREAFFNQGKGANGVVQDPAVGLANKAILDAYTDPIKRTSLNPQELDLAEKLLRIAGSAPIIQKRDVPAGNKPAVALGAAPLSAALNAGSTGVITPQPAPQSSPANATASVLQAARDAIGRGAPRELVEQRLRQNGVDPRGL